MNVPKRLRPKWWWLLIPPVALASLFLFEMIVWFAAAFGLLR